ncbi:Phospholipid phosphatase-related protein type 5 [Takifugu flavidus]|uniref:Phospholipid phosphatase-related protein type 5 n=1 Tax=Takifugu flavidus TaxID=433684 RepID=A0A5C6MTW2_9TELE|nr:Phospholipid phosphatase-related protein type 5 [Takifugu flavidus]
MFYFQLVIMAGTVLLAYYFEYTDTFPVHIQGFFCFDKSYSKPYPGPEDNSKAPPVLVYSLVTAIPTVTERRAVWACVLMVSVLRLCECVLCHIHGNGHYICPLWNSEEKWTIFQDCRL